MIGNLPHANGADSRLLSVWTTFPSVDGCRYLRPTSPTNGLNGGREKKYLEARSNSTGPRNKSRKLAAAGQKSWPSAQMGFPGGICTKMEEFQCLPPRPLAVAADSPPPTPAARPRSNCRVCGFALVELLYLCPQSTCRVGDDCGQQVMMAALGALRRPLVQTMLSRRSPSAAPFSCAAAIILCFIFFSFIISFLLLLPLACCPHHLSSLAVRASALGCWNCC